MPDRATVAIPETMLTWPLYGAGIENLGRNGQPVRWPVPRPTADQVLVRHDAVGLCYSDVKIIRLGGDHPRLYGRDLKTHPIVQGHEVTMTVLEVGEAWRDRYRPGHRLVLQADIYYRGRNLAYGYVFMGGLAPFGLLGPAILAGDEGSYAIPVPAGLGYADIALTEPWACVEAAYAPRRRLHVKQDGVLWILGRPADRTLYAFGDTFIGGAPAVIVLTDVPASLAEALRRGDPYRAGAPFSVSPTPEIVVRDGISPGAYRALAESMREGQIDDIIALGPHAEQVEALLRVTAPGATVALAGTQPLGRPVSVDVGRIHYDSITYLGTHGLDIGAAYGDQRNRAELRSGGVAWIVGGGGPMGRMHLQRMLEMHGGPGHVVVSETNAVRRAALSRSFDGLARAKGVTLRILSPEELEPAALDAALSAAHGGRGFDDIVVIVASAAAIEAAMPYLAADGMLVVFGGLARGTMAALDLSAVYLGNAQITGTSGSTIRDQAAVMDKVASGQLSTASAVAAIGGLDAAKDGIQALIDRRFPGKMVIYPQVSGFPLTALEDLERVAPSVHDALSDTGTWTQEAEMTFLRAYAGDVYD